MDLIRFIQRVIGKLLNRRELFQFTPTRYGLDGPQPDPLKQRQEALGRTFGTCWFSRQYPGVLGRVHLHDTMLQSDSPEELEHYAQAGLSALNNIESALKAAGRDFSSITSCLDMACGYGRVLRLLIQKIPPSGVVACDIEEQAVRFVSEIFRVKPLLSSEDFSNLEFDSAFDLIWVGSLFTHLEPQKGIALMDRMVKALKPEGILVFSVQGEPCLTDAQLAVYGFMFVGQEQSFYSQMAQRGIAYLPYYPQLAPDYGIAIYRRETFETFMQQRYAQQLDQVYFREQGWDGHQDVYAFKRRAIVA